MIKHIINYTTCLGIATYLLPAIAFANDYKQLTSGNLPFVKNTMDISGLLNALFAISVGVAAILAVIMLAIGGFRYMTHESVIDMGDAREQMTNAVVGLLIVLASVLILYTINPDIVKFNLFS